MIFPTPTMRTFYRCYILPAHIEKAQDSKRRESLSEELTRRQAEVVALDLEEECQEYIAAQEHKQATYDALIEAQNRGDDIDVDEVLAAEEKMAAVRTAFTKTYH